jgi:hypothetical protein
MGGKKSENPDQGSINLRKGEKKNKDETIQGKEKREIKIRQLKERRIDKYGLGQHQAQVRGKEKERRIKVVRAQVQQEEKN